MTVITAQAQQQSEQIRGEGDGERNRIFAEAYGADPEFFAFYRSMQAYEKSLRQRADAGADQSEVGLLPILLHADTCPRGCNAAGSACDFHAFSEGGLK